MNEDPWKNLTPPSAANAINAKRVDAEVPWGFFWARGIDGNCLFVIQHSVEATPSSSLPRLQGVEVSDSEWLDGHSRILIFRLEDSAQRDLFYELCLDIVSCSSQASTEKEAVRLAIARTWRWHHLLRGGGDYRLSPEEQKGLIGELLVIERHLLPHTDCIDAVGAWNGPLGAPKDFAIGHVCIEVKARCGAAVPHIKISSESQLDESSIGSLLLYVVDLDRAPSDAPVCFSLNDVAVRVRDLIADRDQGAIEAFEGRIAASGFRWADDYTNILWLEGAHRVYRVMDGFPRITPDQVCAGVIDVRYSISLTECHPYLTDVAALESFVRGEINGV